jgi:hypothetical protein
MIEEVLMARNAWRRRLLVGIVCAVPAAATGSGDLPAGAPDEAAWEAVKLAVARNAASSKARFFKSLRMWARPDVAAQAAADGALTVSRGDLMEPLFDSGRRGIRVVHVHGDLRAPLRVGDHSEVVIGGSIRREGRIDAEGIAAIHVQKDVDGVVACTSSADLWVGGHLNGAVLTGEPAMKLHVGGDFRGSMRPLRQPALLYLGVGGHMAVATIRDIDARKYIELEVTVAASDVGVGVHPLPSSRNGFLAVTGLNSAKATGAVPAEPASRAGRSGGSAE